MLDVGMISPRADALYAWSARELHTPELAGLISDGVPTYAWDAHDTEGWKQARDKPAKVLHRIIPPQRLAPNGE